MDAAVLHTPGKQPRYELFPEPIAGDGEVIVHVYAVSLKPIDKQLASGSHYASPRAFLTCAVHWGISTTGNVPKSPFLDNFWIATNRPNGTHLTQAAAARRAKNFTCEIVLSSEFCKG